MTWRRHREGDRQPLPVGDNPADLSTFERRSELANQVGQEDVVQMDDRG